MDLEFRKSPPAPLAPVSFDIPKPVEQTLENGLRVVVIEDARLPLVSFRLSFFTGDINDPDDRPGLSSAMASMLTEGTETYSSLQLAEKIERLGAGLSASASYDFTTLSASSLSLYSSSMIALLAEITRRPTFPETELDLYRRNTIENLKFQRSQPGFLAGEQAARLVYGEHPYSRVSPKSTDIEALTRSELVSHHRRTLIPNNAILVVVGDISFAEVISELTDHFGSWVRGDVSELHPAEPPSRSDRTITIVDRPGSAQSNIVIGNLAAKRIVPDYFALIVMNQVLGAGASSRVFMNLREEKGYTYGAYTRVDLKRLSGDFEATAEVRTVVTGESLHEFFYELGRIRDEKVSDEELADAKSFLAGVFPIRAETQEGLTNLILNQQLYGLPQDHLQTYRKQVNAVTADEVLAAAQKYVRPDEMAIVIVGDAEEVLPQVKKYTENFEIFDTEGNILDESKYNAPVEADVDPTGEWSLKIDFQGQQLPVKLTLALDGDNLSGELESMLGVGKISEGKVSGNRVTATASTEMQGQSVEFSITGKIVDDEMSGTLTAPIVPDPLPFTGSRT